MGEELPGTELATWIEAHRGRRIQKWQRLIGGAGAREYARVTFEDGGSWIWMHALPEDPAILPPALREPQEELPFLSVTRFLAHQGVPVPELYGADIEHRWLLLEDLGDVHLSDLPESDRRPREHEALELLARVHGIAPCDELPFRRRFDAEWIRFEWTYFLALCDDSPQSEGLRDGLDAFVEAIVGLAQTLCLRDFQSQNLMIDAQGRMRLLDYQDALLAPAELDLVSFIYDSYLDRGRAEREELLNHYDNVRGSQTPHEALSLLGVQRKCKDWSRFLYVAHEHGDERFLRFVADTQTSILSLLDGLPSSLTRFAQDLRSIVEEDRA